ncbi:hypothetical protein DBR06_SOUSAS10010040, partial [Sousa chinensis]
SCSLTKMLPRAPVPSAQVAASRLISTKGPRPCFAHSCRTEGYCHFIEDALREMQHSRGEQQECKYEGTDGKLFRGRVNQGTSWAKDGCRHDVPSGTQLREGRLLGRSRGSLKLELKGLVLGKQAVVIQISGEELQKRVAAMEATQLTK